MPEFFKGIKGSRCDFFGTLRIKFVVFSVMPFSVVYSSVINRQIGCSDFEMFCLNDFGFLRKFECVKVKSCNPTIFHGYSRYRFGGYLRAAVNRVRSSYFQNHAEEPNQIVEHVESNLAVIYSGTS